MKLFWSPWIHNHWHRISNIWNQFLKESLPFGLIEDAIIALAKCSPWYQEHGKRPKVKSRPILFLLVKMWEELILTLLHRQKSSWGTDFQSSVLICFSKEGDRKLHVHSHKPWLPTTCTKSYPSLNGFPAAFIHWAAQDNSGKDILAKRNSKEMTVYMYNLWKK